MLGLEDDYTPEELERIERMAQHGLEACAAEGFYISYETHLLAAELALMAEQVSELVPKIEALLSQSKHSLDNSEETGAENSDGSDILSTF